MSALGSSGFKRVLLFAVACFAVAGVLVPVRADPESAEIAALRTKAEKGNGIAQFNLGLAYAQGREVPIDLTEAFIWLSLAAENGTTGKALESVIGRLSVDQMADSQRRLNERRLALSSTPAIPAAGATRPGGAIKASTGGFNLGHPAVVATAIPEEATPKATSSEPAPTAAPPPPADSNQRGASTAHAGTNLRDPSSGLLQIIGSLRDEKQQLGIELAQTRRELGKNQAELAQANTDLAALRLQLARLELGAAKSTDGAAAAEKPKADDRPPHSP